MDKCKWDKFFFLLFISLTSPKAVAKLFSLLYWPSNKSHINTKLFLISWSHHESFYQAFNNQQKTGITPVSYFRSLHWRKNIGKIRDHKNKSRFFILHTLIVFLLSANYNIIFTIQFCRLQWICWILDTWPALPLYYYCFSFRGEGILLW